MPCSTHLKAALDQRATSNRPVRPVRPEPSRTDRGSHASARAFDTATETHGSPQAGWTMSPMTSGN